MAATHTFSKREELANAVIHGIGVILSVVGLIVLLQKALQLGSIKLLLAYTIFGTSMLLLYVCSTLVHSFPEGKLKDLFEILDHAAIYIFIAGTYTPILLLIIQGKRGWLLLWLLWGIAILGVIFKVFFVKKFLFTSTMIYVFMGWMVVFVWQPLVENYSSIGLQFLIIGGVLYTIGTIFYMWRSFPYHHAVWHLFVLAGSIFHFFSILYYA